MRRLLPRFALSVMLWVVLVGATWWWLMRDSAPATVTTDAGSTEADSPGLPLFGVPLLTALLVLGTNFLVLGIEPWRRRDRGIVG